MNTTTHSTTNNGQILKHFHYQGKPSDLAMLLQAGFQVKALVGCTLREFLCIEMEICGDYANKRLQTIFIDGLAVDDFDESYIRPGTTLALSGAMPGLVGAVMRRGGELGTLRDTITYHLDELRPKESQGVVTVKLYNFIAEELAHIFLRRGIMVETEKVRRFFPLNMAEQKGILWESPSGDMTPVKAEEFTHMLQPGERIFITATEQEAA